MRRHRRRTVQTTALLKSLTTVIVTVMKNKPQRLTVLTTWQTSTQHDHRQRELRHQVPTAEDLCHPQAQIGGRVVMPSRILHEDKTEESRVRMCQPGGQGMTARGQEMTARVHRTYMIAELLHLTLRDRHRLDLVGTAVHSAKLLPCKVGHHRIDGMRQKLVEVQEVQVLVREMWIQ